MKFDPRMDPDRGLPLWVLITFYVVILVVLAFTWK